MPKALVPVRGIPIVERAVRGILGAAIEGRGVVAGIIVTAPRNSLDTVRSLFAQDERVYVISGGHSRQDSVRLGLEEIPLFAQRLGYAITDTTPVLIHDAARCLTPSSVVAEVVNALLSGDRGVVPVLPVTDSLKRVHSVCAIGEIIQETVDRADLRAAQTPQGFHWAVITQAHMRQRQRGCDETVAATDDSALVEEMGVEVRTLNGSPLAMKITTPFDVVVAETLMERGNRECDC